MTPLYRLSLSDLRAIYAHAASLAELIDGHHEVAPLHTRLVALVDALEYHFADTDQLVDRQPVLVRTETVEVQ